MTQWAKDLALSLQKCRFDPWLKEIPHATQVQLKKSTIPVFSELMIFFLFINIIITLTGFFLSFFFFFFWILRATATAYGRSQARPTPQP